MTLSLKRDPYPDYEEFILRGPIDTYIKGFDHPDMKGATYAVTACISVERNFYNDNELMWLLFRDPL